MNFNLSEIYRSVNYTGSLHFDKHQKKSIHCLIYIRFNQNFDEKSYVSAKIETVKHLCAIFLLTGTAPTSSQIAKNYGLILTSLTSRPGVVIGM